jgi:pimeloyl-ACP methyl ester carboxylesterase
VKKSQQRGDSVERRARRHPRSVVPESGEADRRRDWLSRNGAARERTAQLMETVREPRIQLSDGAETTLQRWGESGPLVLGVHGVGASRRGWARIGEHLAARVRVVAYDQRGHGDSSAQSPMTLERILADLGDVVSSLDEPVHALMGHSWGGAVAVIGGRGLDVVGRVVAIDPMLRLGAGLWSTSVLREHRPALALSPDEREVSIRRSYAGLPEVEVASKLHATRRLSIDTLEALGADSEIEAGRWDYSSAVYDYPKPLLLALPDPARSVVPPDEREELRRLGGPNVHFAVFEGAGHSLHREAFDRFIPVLEAFLNE